ncbi:hypothetical protein M8C21_002118 [Ambrosia artemisiifolia]|uniref:Uncharacterized protein n=1 Tax=Ambrosia artemisiifolia TaxID=4212 RepID=A0AAD5BS81_AMBAR|nr:hypothetical protein M8C21_002118 [Ambrosia artemisiifolia]
MSRCFPYPPPGYYRNGATHDALIESIKLQKETNKTKSDRKKEKKGKKEKEKRHKEKRNNKDSYTVLQNSAYCTAAQINASTELLEKSDLTQEHGQPVNQHQPSYSSDSTENSNKRKRDDHSFITDNSSGNGSFKIRLTKKQKGSESSSIVADVRSNTNSSLSSFTSDRGLVSCMGKSGVSAASGRENRTQTQTKSNLVSKGTTIGDLNRVHFGRIQSAPSSAKPFLQSTRPQQQVLPRIHLEHEAPSSFVSTNVNEQGLHFARQQQLATCYRGVSNLVTNKTSTSDAGRTSINEVSVAVNGGLTKQKEDPQKVGPSRSEKKMLKKQAKYEKLIGSWLPPVFQADVPDDDWLSSSKTSSSSILKGEVETCRESVASWQPCARFLAEADIHALPYTVPF